MYVYWHKLDRLINNKAEKAASEERQPLSILDAFLRSKTMNCLETHTGIFSSVSVKFYLKMDPGYA